MQVSVLVIMVTLRMSSGYHLAFYVPFEYKNYNRDETKNGNRYPHALTIAIDDVNNNPNILPGHNLTYSWTDSTESNVVLRTMYEKYIQSNRSKPVDAFIGPAFHCAAPAKVAKAFDIPMISYLCLEDGPFHKRDYPLFIRTYQNTNSQATSALLALLQELQWKQIGIIYENVTRWKDLKKAIEKDGEEMDLEITQDVLPAGDLFDHYAGYADRYYKPAMIRNESLQRTRNVLTKMAKEKAIKIFVIVTSHDVLMDVMAEVNNLGLAGSKKPHRAFIGFQLDVTKSSPNYARKNEMFYNKNILDRNDELKRRRLTRNAARSLLIISCAEPKNGERYEKFENELTNRAKSAEPFNTSADARERSDVAPALYDAVYQYALALDRLHKRNARISAQAVVDEFRSHSYISMGGFTSVFLPESGDLKVHFRLLHLDYAITQKTPKTQPTKIANFTYNKTSAIEIRLRKINWPWGTENPSDQANCKDDNYDCPKNFVKHTFLQVVLIVLSVVLCVIFIILVTFITRQWRREQELKRSIWQIDIVDIVFDRKVSTDSKFSDDSGVRSFHEMELDFLLPRDKQGSYNDSELPDLTEETTEYPMKSFSAIRNMTGNFKGDRVFVKIFPKNVDISQSLQKELRMLRNIHHENLNPFVGLGVETSHLWIVMQLGSKGTLEEVLANQDVTLNYSFVLSLVYDIAKGMTFLHKSDIKSHGNIKSSNCVIDNRWVLKITDYGIPEIRSRQLRFTNPQDEDKKFKDLLWRAPELLRQTDPSPRGTQKGDVYSFAIILEEFHTLKSPYSNSHIPTREIIDRIVDAEVPPYRPVVIEPIENAESLLGLMKECWKETPEERPSFDDVKYEVENQMIRSGLKTDICDNMIMLLENYSNDLENVVSERTSQLRDEKHKTDALLDRMLPRPVAEQLKKGENVQAESFSSVTIYFSDIVQFTALCAESTPMEVVDLLNDLYLLFDDIIMDYSVYKVETIGDAYMVVSGLPMRNGKLHASEICCMALEILDNVVNFKVKHKPDHELQVRIGIHTGPVVAGVVGMTMPRYCLFGDTVNTASRMESNGEALRIHISESTKNILEELGGFHVRQRPEQVYLKGKGNCTTYWLQGASPDVPRCPRKLSKKALKPLFQNPNSRKMSAPFRSRKKTQTSIPRASIA